MFTASADLGVSLHTSSSGFDLPMKIVDMFGCGLPVCAVGYDWLVTNPNFSPIPLGFHLRRFLLDSFISLKELVTDGKNGMIFKTAGDLADKLLAWFHGFPQNNEENRQLYRRQLEVYQSLRWHSEWCKVALPLLSVD